MNTLIFGRSGQVARELRRRVPDAVALGRDEADLSDPDACYRAVITQAPDFVINAAAWTNVDGAETNEAEALVINGKAPGEMARAAAELGIPIIHISTDYVFDGRGNSAFSRDDVPSPVSAYGRTKLAGEIAVRTNCPDHVILRTSWVFSAHGANFVKTMLRVARSRESVNVVSDQVSGPTPAGDIAQACLTIAQNYTRGYAGTWHFNGAPDVSWAGFCREIYSLAGISTQVHDIPSEEYPTPARRPKNSRLNCDVTLERLNLSRPDWKAGLRNVLAELEQSE